MRFTLSLCSLLRVPTTSFRRSRNNEWFDGFDSRSKNVALVGESARGQSLRKPSRRPPPKNRRAIIWCVQSVEKILKGDGEQKGAAPQSSNAKDDSLLVEALWLLSKARTL